MWCRFLPFSSPPSPLCRASGRRVYSKENLATGKSVFEDLTDSSTGAVHLPRRPSLQASGMLAQRTSRGDSQPPGLCQCRLRAHSGKERERGGRKPEENREKEVLQKFYILHKASLASLSPGLHTASPTPSIPALPHFLLQASRTFIRLPTTVHIVYMSLLLFYMNAVCLHYTKLLSVQTGCIMVHYLLL